MFSSYTIRGWEWQPDGVCLFGRHAAFLRRGVASGYAPRPWRIHRRTRRATASILAPANVVLWLAAPPLLLFLFYWTTGLLFVAPMAGVEKVFLQIDRDLHIRELSSRTPAWLVEILEFAYAGVFGLIPIALALHLSFATAPDADRFWLVILVTDFVCFGMLPWIQSRPPRALEPGDPWRSSLRSFNLRVLGAASIQVNTFPSGHAAEALVAALLVAALSPWILGVMMLAALAVAGGAVLGRYHYAIDAFAGWFVALAVWVLLG
jgi:membrane-associated phospholipid phosphatase